MASHSSSLAWRSPWTEEPGRLQSMGWHRVRHNWSDLAQWLGKKKKSRPTYKEKKLMVTGWEMKGGRGLSGLFYTIIYKAIYMSILKKISPEYSLEGLCWSWNSQYFGHLIQRTDSLEKCLMLGKTEGRRRRGWQRMRWLDGITDPVDVSFE